MFPGHNLTLVIRNALQKRSEHGCAAMLALKIGAGQGFGYDVEPKNVAAKAEIGAKVLLTSGSNGEVTWQLNLFSNSTKSSRNRSDRLIAQTRTANLAKSCGKRKRT